MLQHLMKSKQTHQCKSPPDIDENYKLSMPLQQNNVKDSQDSSRRMLKFDKSINDNSVNAGKIIKNNEDNEIYSMYQNQVKQLRDSKNEIVVERNSANMANYGHTNKGMSQNRQMLNKIDEESISYESNHDHNEYQRNQSVNANNLAPYHDQESVLRSIEIVNSTQGRKTNRYDQQIVSSNKFVPQDYMHNNQFVALSNQNQRSTEFTFVGTRKHVSSPHAHLNQREVVCSSRQSITLNPLIEENTVSTTKKQASFNREYMNNQSHDDEYINTNQEYAQNVIDHDNMNYHNQNMGLEQNEMMNNEQDQYIEEQVS